MYAVITRYLSDPALVALVSVYATLFLYHRIYDSVLLTGTLIWAAHSGVNRLGRQRWAAIGVCLAVLSVWFVRVGVLRAIVAATKASEGWLTSLASATVLAYPMWALIAASILIVVADRGCSAHATMSEKAAC